MTTKRKENRKGMRVKSGLVILITLAIFMLLIAWLQQNYSRKQIRISLERNTEMELIIRSSSIRNVLGEVELAVQNHEWETRLLLPYPDSLFGLTLRMVEQNPSLDGCCIGMISDYYPEKGHYFEPYTLRRNDVIETVQLGSEEHDYLQGELFIKTVKNDTCYWSEPYSDPYNADITLITYADPIHDESGEIVGVIGVDLNSKWLSEVLNRMQLYPSSYALLVSGKGQLICGPSENQDKLKNAGKMAEMLSDSTVRRSNSTSGRSRWFAFTDADGDKGSVYYFSPSRLAPWTIAIVNYDKEVFAPLRTLGWQYLLLTLLGMLVFAFIIHRTAQNLIKLEQAQAENQRTENELNIAKSIQMDMLPKADAQARRDDVSVFGLLEPARIVGGDLYDHFIRDEKLFFCIGDVSGKGVPAALVMTMTHSLFRNIAAHESNPSRIMHILNESVCQGNTTNMFVTFFIGVLDLPTGKLRYCNAGHDLPFVIGKTVRQLPAKPHLPLGVTDEIRYTTEEENLSANETFFLYTDGLTEAMNAKHELFGVPRLTSALNELAAGGNIQSESLVGFMTERVKAFVQDAEQSDDLTMLAFQYTPKQEEITFRDTLVIANKLEEITRLNAFVKSVTTALNIESGLANKLKLAVEEVVTNIISYAYPNKAEDQVEIVVEADKSLIRFIITDSGVEFDPTSVSKADTTLTLDERPIGGLGIFLVRNLMDSINYERTDNKNRLRLEKKLI